MAGTIRADGPFISWLLVGRGARSLRERLEAGRDTDIIYFRGVIRRRNEREIVRI